jgi:hypothetical protein
MKLKGEVFSSDGSYTIMNEDGDDLAIVTRVTTHDDLGADEEPKHGAYRTTDAEYQEIIDRVHAAVEIDLPSVIERMKADLAFHAEESARITRESLDFEATEAYTIENDTMESYHTGRVEAMSDALNLLLGREVKLYSETE